MYNNLNLVDEFEDDDEEILVILPRPRRPRNIWERQDLFQLFEDGEFQTRFRLSKEVVLVLLNHIGHLLEPPTYRYLNRPIYF